MKSPKILLKSLVAVVLVGLSSLVLGGCTVSQADLTKYNNLIREADTLYEQRDYQSAMQRYSEAADLVPKESDAFFGLVAILTDKAQYDLAGELVEKSTGRIDSADRSRLYALVGNGYQSIEDLQNAEKYYLLANRGGVENVPAKIGLAQVYIKNGEMDKAKKYLDVEDVKDPNFVQAALLRAFLKLDSVNDAKKEVEDISTTGLDEDLKDTVDSYLGALNSAGSDRLYTAALLSREYLNSGYPYLAVKLLEPLAEDMSEYPDGLYFLGRAYYDYGQIGSAIDVLQDATSFGFYTPELYTLLAKASYINSDQESAFAYFEKAISFASDEQKDGLLMDYTDLLFELEQYTKAEEYLGLANQDAFWVNLRYVELHYSLRDYEKMAFYTSKVAEMTLTDQEKKEYLKWQITYEIENDQVTSARENLAILRELDRFNPEYYLLLGRLELTQNNVDDGREALVRAVEYDLEGEATESAKKLLARVD